MSLTTPESQLPNSLTPQESVEAAYAAEMAEVAGQVVRGLPSLIECDKELAPYLFVNLRARLRDQNIRCIYLDGRPREADDGKLSRQDGNLTVTVDPCNGEVSVKSEVAEAVTIEAKREAAGYDDVGPGVEGVRERARADLKKDLDKKADRETERLQTQATEALEKHLAELQPELSQVVNKIFREALKEKAKQLGTVTEIAEDAQTGSLTIKIEV